MCVRVCVGIAVVDMAYGSGLQGSGPEVKVT